MRWNAIMALAVSLFTVNLLTNVAQAREPRPFRQTHRDGLVFNWPVREAVSVLDQRLERIAKTGAKHVTIPFYGCQPDGKSNEVGSCTSYDESIPILQAERAMALGFGVTFLPIVLTPTGEWRGEFIPTDRARWFETYTAWIEHVAQIAESMKMPAFIVASEFKYLYRFADDWKKVIEAVRDDFSEPIIVTGNWDNPDLTFWDESDALGLSNYTPLTQTKDPSQTELSKAAVKNRDLLLEKSKKYKRPLYLTEMGYASLPTAAAKPWYYAQKPEDLVSDLELQEKCFESMVTAWSKTKELVHVGIWATGDYSADYSKYNFDVLEKPSEDVLKKFFEVRNQRKR